jgi:hypothetical protein
MSLEIAITLWERARMPNQWEKQTIINHSPFSGLACRVAGSQPSVSGSDGEMAPPFAWPRGT